MMTEIDATIAPFVRFATTIERSMSKMDNEHPIMFYGDVALTLGDFRALLSVADRVTAAEQREREAREDRDGYCAELAALRNANGIVGEVYMPLAERLSLMKERAALLTQVKAAQNLYHKVVGFNAVWNLPGEGTGLQRDCWLDVEQALDQFEAARQPRAGGEGTTK